MKTPGGPRPSPAHHLPPPPRAWLSLLTAVLAVPFLTSFFGANLAASRALLKSPYEGLVQRSPLPGWSDSRVDLTDPQWSAWREGAPALTVLCAGEAFLVTRTESAALKNRIRAALSLGLLVYLHHLDVVWLLAVAIALHACVVSIKLDSRVVALVGFAVLVVVKTMGNSLLFSPSAPFRWTICFNLVFLRLISFAFDAPHCNVEPTLVDVFAYLYHVPTYVSGPIVTFETFIRPFHARPSTNKRIYLARLVFALVVFELWNRLVYINVLVKVGKWTAGDYYRQLAIATGISQVELMTNISFAALFTLWFKFMIIWRYARFWGLLEGIDYPENMRRCVANNFSIVDFWKDWHSSFNVWLVRYVYIPLGGNKHGPGVQVLSTFVCFAFVAGWHDLELHLWAWAFAICLLIVPELIVRRSSLGSTWPEWARHSALAVGGGLNIIGLQLVNLVGYSLGVQGTRDLITLATTTSAGRWFTLSWFAWMVTGAAIMIQQRKHEKS